MQGFASPTQPGKTRPQNRKQQVLGSLFTLVSACLTRLELPHTRRSARAAWHGIGLAVLLSMPWQARATDIEYHAAATYNMQGGTAQGESKWNTDVLTLMKQHEILALQEAGSPPSAAVEIERVQTAQGLFRHLFWAVSSNRDSKVYNIYWLQTDLNGNRNNCLLYTSPSPRDRTRSRMPSSA